MIAGDKSGKKVSSSSIIIGISGKGGGNEGNEDIRNGVRSISIGCKMLSRFKVEVLLQVFHLHLKHH